MSLPHHYWFENRHPSIKLPDSKSSFVQIFNGCQVGVDVGKLWNEFFYRMLFKLNIHMSVRDLAIYVRIIDDELVIPNVSTDDISSCTKHNAVQSKLVSHLRNFFPFRTKEDPIIDYLNCSIMKLKSILVLVKQHTSNPSQTIIFLLKIFSMQTLPSDMTIKYKLTFLTQPHELNLNLIS